MCLVNEDVKSKGEIQKPVEPNIEMLPTERSLLPMLLLQEQEKTKPSEGMDSLLPIMLFNNADNPGYKSIGRKSGSGPECGFQNKDLNVGDKAVIQTPNYPANYPSDIQCIWWLR